MFYLMNEVKAASSTLPPSHAALWEGSDGRENSQPSLAAASAAGESIEDRTASDHRTKTAFFLAVFPKQCILATVCKAFMVGISNPVIAYTGGYVYGYVIHKYYTCCFIQKTTALVDFCIGGANPCRH